MQEILGESEPLEPQPTTHSPFDSQAASFPLQQHRTSPPFDLELPHSSQRRWCKPPLESCQRIINPTLRVANQYRCSWSNDQRRQESNTIQEPSSSQVIRGGNWNQRATRLRMDFHLKKRPVKKINKENQFLTVEQRKKKKTL